MTAFAYPLQIRRPEGEAANGAGAVRGRVHSIFSAKVSVGQTGTAVGATTLPLFVAPAGSYFHDAVLDVLTGFDNTAGVNITVGVPTSTGILVAATTANTAGRRIVTPTGAQVSAWAIPLTADTTVEAIVSITTSTVTAGEVAIHVVIR